MRADWGLGIENYILIRTPTWISLTKVMLTSHVVNKHSTIQEHHSSSKFILQSILYNEEILCFSFNGIHSKQRLWIILATFVNSLKIPTWYDLFWYLLSNTVHVIYNFKLGIIFSLRQQVSQVRGARNL